ncbi:MFS transporter [Pseudonocardia sp. TRM90224]|uniref:MFS transporter n=1 Tax=Pseudonocardia sp. TRM90224 TaxID=2812678 RepID=UPI001E35A9A8|nr:MFS transporter [Pseudonocardia sp. TRM90224]
MEPVPSLAPRATLRTWLGLVVLLLPGLFVSMDLSVLYYALPALSADLRPTAGQMLWILDVYGFVLAGLLITAGTVGDRIGRRRLLLIGAVLFAAASVAAAFATSPEWLIAARAVLGVAGATLAPSTLSLIRTMFLDTRQRQLAVGLWTMGFAGGALLGPIVGGLLLAWTWWGAVFLINLPVMAVLLVLGPVLLPEYRDPSPGRLDMIGVALSLGAVLPFVQGVKKVADDGLGWDRVVLLAAGLAIGYAFVRRQLVAPHPMIDVRLFRRIAFTGAVVTCAVTFFLLAGSALFIAQYLQVVLGYTVLEAALWNVPGIVGMALGITAATALGGRARPAALVAAGLGVGAAGFALLAQVGPSTGLAWVVAAQVVLSCGIGAVSTVATGLVLSTAPVSGAGAASAVSESANELGAAFGIAVLGSIGTSVYAATLAASAPDGVPPDVVGAASETVGSATEIAATLPPDVGMALTAAADRAFVSGMQGVAWAGAVGAVAIGALVLVALRDVREES